MTLPASCLRIAIVGAESTGKTTLARELAAALATGPGDADARSRWTTHEVMPAAMRHTARTAIVSGPAAAEQRRVRVALVGEVLREWCDAAGRTPRADEQRGILTEQHRRIEAAAATHDIVVSDTTALMTHVYSDLLFGDRSLLPLAVDRHRAMGATLLTALDLPWVADGHQRDGEHVRQPVDDRLREVLQRHRLPYAVVAGTGPARLAQALAALRPSLAAWVPPARGVQKTQEVPLAGGLFTRLVTTQAAPGRFGWVCDCCVPEAEQALMRRREGARSEAGGAMAARLPE